MLCSALHSFTDLCEYGHFSASITIVDSGYVAPSPPCRAQLREAGSDFDGGGYGGHDLRLFQGVSDPRLLFRVAQLCFTLLTVFATLFIGVLPRSTAAPSIVLCTPAHPCRCCGHAEGSDCRMVLTERE